ncbi:MAG: hypothetical protein ABSA34_03600 [Candidatus Goldiibacteriota bacterium]
MAKKQSVIKSIISWVVTVIILVCIPAFIIIFAQPKYAVFDGMATFLMSNNIWVFIAVFILILSARIFIKKARPAFLKGAAVYSGAWIAGTLLNKILLAAVHMHAFAWLYLIYVLMCFSYYNFEELPPLFNKTRDFMIKAGKVAGVILAWIWLAVVVLAVPFIILAIAKENEGFGDFFSQNPAATRTSTAASPRVAARHWRRRRRIHCPDRPRRGYCLPQTVFSPWGRQAGKPGPSARSAPLRCR